MKSDNFTRILEARKIARDSGVFATLSPAGDERELESVVTHVSEDSLEQVAFRICHIVRASIEAGV